MQKKYLPEIDLLKKKDFSGYQKLIYTPRKYQVMSIYSQVSKKSKTSLNKIKQNSNT